MTSVAFWLSFAAVFLGIRWIADMALSVMSTTPVVMRRVRPVARVVESPADERLPSILDEAA